MVNSLLNTSLLCVLAALFINIISGFIYSLAILNQYYVSYLYHSGLTNITLNDCFFIMPLAIFFHNCFAGLGGYIERKFGQRITVFSGLVFMSLGLSIFYFFTSIILSYIGAIVYGIGTGLCYLSSMRASWRHYPNKKGLITGVLLAGFGFSSSIFNLIADRLINPFLEKPLENNIYSKEIANKVPLYFLVVLIATAAVGFISIIILFPYQESSKGDNYMKLEYLSEYSIDLSLNNQPVESTNESDSEPILVAFKSREIYIICALAFSFIFYPFMFLNLIRPFASLYLKEDFIQILMIVIPIANGLSRIFWGSLIDFFQFKILYGFNIFLGIAFSSTIGLMIETEYYFFIPAIFSASLIGAHYALIPPLMSKIYGLKNCAELYGIVCFTCGLSSLSGSLIAKFVIREIANRDYLITFWVGGFLQIIAVILLVFVRESKFKYTPKIKLEINVE